MVRIALVFGGQSPEHEVSIVSARFVYSQLIELGFEVEPVGIDVQGNWLYGPHAFDQLCDRLERPGKHGNDPGSFAIFASREYDLVFPMIHGVTGEDGSIQGLCELLSIPYVGGGVLNQSLCFDKLSTRLVLREAGLRQPQFRAFHIQHLHDRGIQALLDDVSQSLGFPVFVKPSRTGSSIGVNKVYDPDQCEKALHEAFHYDQRVIVEEHIEGREIEMAAIGGIKPFLTDPGEIIPTNDFYDFAEKYINNNTTFVVPAEMDDGPLTEMKKTAELGWRHLYCYGMARIDFLVSDSGVYLNEINTTPGFTKISMYPRLLETSGMPIQHAIKQLVDLALERAATGGRKKVFLSQSDWFKAP